MKGRVEKNENLAKEIEKEKKKQEFEEKRVLFEKKARKIIKIFSLAFLIFTSFFYYTRFLEPSMLLVSEIRIENAKVPASLSGLKLLHFSDLHYKTTTNEAFLIKLVDSVNALKPDIIVFTGDLLESEVSYTKEDYQVLTEKLSELACTISKYYVKGEEDYENDGIIEIIMKDAGFILLDNLHDTIYGTVDEKIQIYGLGIQGKNDFHQEEAFQEFTPDVFSIALFHEPDSIDKLANYPVDIALSGHSHNNQLQIPLIHSLLKKEGATAYLNGHYILSNTHLFVNSGLGTDNGLKLRFLSFPTLNFYRFVRPN